MYSPLQKAILRFFLITLILSDIEITATVICRKGETIRNAPVKPKFMSAQGWRHWALIEGDITCPPEVSTKSGGVMPPTKPWVLTISNKHGNASFVVILGRTIQKWRALRYRISRSISSFDNNDSTQWPSDHNSFHGGFLYHFYILVWSEWFIWNETNQPYQHPPSSVGGWVCNPTQAYIKRWSWTYLWVTIIEEMLQAREHEWLGMMRRMGVRFHLASSTSFMSAAVRIFIPNISSSGPPSSEAVRHIGTFSKLSLPRDMRCTWRRKLKRLIKCFTVEATSGK